MFYVRRTLSLLGRRSGVCRCPPSPAPYSSNHAPKINNSTSCSSNSINSSHAPYICNSTPYNTNPAPILSSPAPCSTNSTPCSSNHALTNSSPAPYTTNSTSIFKKPAPSSTNSSYSSSHAPFIGSPAPNNAKSTRSSSSSAPFLGSHTPYRRKSTLSSSSHAHYSIKSTPASPAPLLSGPAPYRTYSTTGHAPYSTKSTPASPAPFLSGHAPYSTNSTTGPAPCLSGHAPYSTNSTTGPAPCLSGPAPYSTNSTTGPAPFLSGPAPLCAVLQSRSTDVHLNLALEAWVDAGVEQHGGAALLLWRNRPAVVVGRHQNPWREANMAAARRAGVALARRRSGGGAVFHDLGNLNLTFFASKVAYDRGRNLGVVTETLRRLKPDLDVRATDRLDIVLDGRLKISGSASRLSRKSSYHHCTLLHSADRSALSAVLRPSCPGIHSNATPSVPSPVANLTDHVPTMHWEELLDALVHQYNKEFGFNAPLTVVDPSDESQFPGIGALAAELRSWDWIFGKTPKFSVRTALDLGGAVDGVCGAAQLEMEVKNGVIETCEVGVAGGWLPRQLSEELGGVLVGERFCPHRAAAAVSTLLRREDGEQRERLRRLGDAVVAAMG